MSSNLRRGSDTIEYRRMLGVPSIWPAAPPGSLLAGATPGHVRAITLGTLLLPRRTVGAESFLLGSACRHAGRTVSSPASESRAWRAVSEDPALAVSC